MLRTWLEYSIQIVWKNSADGKIINSAYPILEPSSYSFRTWPPNGSDKPSPTRPPVTRALRRQFCPDQLTSGCVEALDLRATSSLASCNQILTEPILSGPVPNHSGKGLFCPTSPCLLWPHGANPIRTLTKSFARGTLTDFSPFVCNQSLTEPILSGYVPTG